MSDERRNRDQKFFSQLNPTPTEADLLRARLERAERLGHAARRLLSEVANHMAKTAPDKAQYPAIGDAWNSVYEALLAFDAQQPPAPSE